MLLKGTACLGKWHPLLVLPPCDPDDSDPPEASPLSRCPLCSDLFPTAPPERHLPDVRPDPIAVAAPSHYRCLEDEKRRRKRKTSRRDKCVTCFFGRGEGMGVLNLEEYFSPQMISSLTSQPNTTESEITLSCSIPSPEPNTTLEKCSFAEILDAYLHVKEGIIFIAWLLNGSNMPTWTPFYKFCTIH